MNMIAKTWVVTIVVMVSLVCGPVEAKLEKLVLSGPLTVETYPLLYIVEHDLLGEVSARTEFVPWNNPDQVRALIVGRQVDVAVLATAAAANFYNKKVGLKLMDVSYPSSLWIISTDPHVTSLKDLKNKEIAMPFRGDMPEIIFSCIAAEMGLDPGEDFHLRYAGNPMDAVQLLMLGRVGHAFLGEPAVSTALCKAPALPAKRGVRLYRGVDMQKEWNRAYGGQSAMPLACTVACPALVSHDDVIRRFRQAYQKAAQWCKASPDEAGKLAARYFPMLKPWPVSEAIKNASLKFRSAADADKDLASFFKILKEAAPRVIGGEVPDNGFYWKGRG